MACNRMPSLSTGDQFRLPLGADWLRHPAPGTEAASRWRVDGAGHFSCQDDAFALAALVRIRDRGCGEQSLGIRVAGLAIHLLHGPRFADLAQIHDRDPVRYMADQRKVDRKRDVKGKSV